MQVKAHKPVPAPAKKEDEKKPSVCGAQRASIIIASDHSVLGLCCAVQLLLNDIAMAVKLNSSAQFEGSIKHAPWPVLEQLIRARQAAQAAGRSADDAMFEVTVKYGPEYDLHGVVCLLFGRLSPAAYEALRPLARDPEAVLRFWQHHMAPSLWSELLQLAKQCSYRQLAESIKTLIP